MKKTKVSRRSKPPKPPVLPKLPASPPTTMTRADIARHLNISERLAHELLHDPVDPIPSFRVGNGRKLIRIRRSDFDAWVERRVDDGGIVDRIVSEIVG